MTYLRMQVGRVSRMLRAHPWVLGRLLHAARDLLGMEPGTGCRRSWRQRHRPACPRVGKNPVATQSLLAVMATLERSGVRFLAATESLGQGVRYAPPRSDAIRSPSPDAKPATGGNGPAQAVMRGSAGDPTHSRSVAAEALIARQRQLVDRLFSAGHDVVLAAELLAHMERSLALMRRRGRVDPSCSSGAARAPICLSAAA